jgi:hypothetical protein
MERKSFVAAAAKDLLAGGQRTSVERAIETAIELADALERAGEAPWKSGSTGLPGAESVAAEDFLFRARSASGRSAAEESAG